MFRKLLLTLSIAAGLIGSAQANTPLDSVYFKASEAGRGYTLEIDGSTKKLMLGIFGYSATGANIWYVSSGTIDGDNYSGRLSSCSGGQTIGGTFRAATCVDAGAVTLAVSQVNGVYGATLSWGGATVVLTQYKIEAGAAYSNAPVTGWYYVASAPGTGAFFQAKGSSLFAALYFYTAAGAPVWYAMEGIPVVTSTGVTVFSGTLTLCSTGQPLGGNYVAPSCSNAGAISVTFGNNTNATITFPNGATAVMGRFPLNG